MPSKDKWLVITGLTVGLVALVVFIGFIGQGNIRPVALFWPEKVEQTVAFVEVDKQVHLQGIKGISGDPNPTLISRTGFAYILTVVNNGEKHHRLYIEGLEIQTDLLEPGQQETLTIIADKEGTYNYYDKRERLQLLGQLKIVTVVPSDEFQGFLKDLI